MIKHKFEIILSLLAGLIMTIACIIDGTELQTLALRVLITMVVFLVIGVIIKWAVILPAFPDPVVEVKAEATEEIENEEQIENEENSEIR